MSTNLLAKPDDFATMAQAYPEKLLTPDQKRQWDETMMLTLFKAAGFRHLFYDLFSYKQYGGTEDMLFTDAIPTAATDGSIIAANPDWFFSPEMPLMERLFVLCHEVQHNVYGDPDILIAQDKRSTIRLPDGTEMPWREDVMQKAADYRINALLDDSKLGRPPGPNRPHPALLDRAIATAKSGVHDTYKGIYEDVPDPQGNKKGPGGGSGKGPGQGQGQSQAKGAMDQIMKPGTLLGTPPDKAPRPSPEKMRVAMTIAKHLQEQCGNMPGALQRMFRDILEPEVPWTDHVRAVTARCTGSGGFTWARPDRRFIGNDLYLPSPTGFNAGWLVAWGDTSGSINEHDLNVYLKEGAGILRDCKPKRMTILWGDTKISHVDEVRDEADLEAIAARGVGGGGGTSIKPIFDWIKDQDETPDLFMGFTDGCFTYPKEPSFPVLWCDISNTAGRYPYGEVVALKPKRD